MKSFVIKISTLLATGFGLGYSPVASGTVGTLLGVALAIAMAPLGWVLQVVIVAVMIAVAVPICHVAEKAFGKKDDGRVVMDEYVTFPLCVIGLPITEHWWLLGVAFLTHRFLDIVKPPPARQSQDIGGGVGIVIDDVISSLYALGVNVLVFYVARRWGGVV